MAPIIVAYNTAHLKELVRSEIERQGQKANLNHLDVSNLKDFAGLFSEFSKFNGDISLWNVSSATNMARMFKGSQFNGDISRWRVSSVLTMESMFESSKFQGDLFYWDTSRVQNMRAMFQESKFKGDLSRWNVASVKTMERIFAESPFAQDVGCWNVSPNTARYELYTDEAFLSAQSMSDWIVLTHLEDSVTPADATWAEAFIEAEKISEVLDLGWMEHVETIKSCYRALTSGVEMLEEQPVNPAVFS